jgi:hypothetical protein
MNSLAIDNIFLLIFLGGVPEEMAFCNFRELKRIYMAYIIHPDTMIIDILHHNHILLLFSGKPGCQFRSFRRIFIDRQPDANI